MNGNHASIDPAAARDLTPEALESYARRARLERSRAAHDLLRGVLGRIAGWIRRAPERVAPHGCADAA